ncbi:Cthe_2314 family HEPN domain-containing protein [Bacillus mycoides]|uniref:Cthe_2314 family HEPN domain-containing protein n=1 Tax=Bacillus mycoides TaxID=1405 RepID=UPI003D658C69
MTIEIDLFEFPTKEEMAPLLKESPLYSYRIEGDLFYWTREQLFGFDIIDHHIAAQDFTSSLNNRIFQLDLSYSYLLYYSNRGISDGEYPYLDKLPNEEWTNKIHFENNVDILFPKAFTALDLLAHLLFACLGLKTEKKIKGKTKNINKSFNSAMYQIKKLDRELYNKLNKIRDSIEFQKASKVRNDIIHNQPPYEMRNEKVKSSGGTETVMVKYTPSKEILNIARGLLELMRQIFIIVEDFLKEKQSCL